MKIDKNELIELIIVGSISLIMAILFYFGWEKSLKTSLLILISSLSSIILYSIFTSFIPKKEELHKEEIQEQTIYKNENAEVMHDL